MFCFKLYNCEHKTSYFSAVYTGFIFKSFEHSLSYSTDLISISVSKITK